MPDGGSSPNAFPGAHCVQNANLSDQEKSLVLVCTHGAMEMAEFAQRMRRSFGSFGTPVRKDFLLAETGRPYDAGRKLQGPQNLSAGNFIPLILKLDSATVDTYATVNIAYLLDVRAATVVSLRFPPPHHDWRGISQASVFIP